MGEGTGCTGLDEMEMVEPVALLEAVSHSPNRRPQIRQEKTYGLESKSAPLQNPQECGTQLQLRRKNQRPNRKQPMNRGVNNRRGIIHAREPSIEGITDSKGCATRPAKLIKSPSTAVTTPGGALSAASTAMSAADAAKAASSGSTLSSIKSAFSGLFSSKPPAPPTPPPPPPPSPDTLHGDACAPLSCKR